MSLVKNFDRNIMQMSMIDPSGSDVEVNAISRNNLGDSIKTVENSTFLQIISEVTALLPSGLGDKSFFICIVMAMMYNHFLIFLSTIFSLILCTTISLYLGNTFSQHVQYYYIDIISSLVFVIFGLLFIIDGIRVSKKMEEDDQNEIQNQIFIQGLSMKGESEMIEELISRKEIHNKNHNEQSRLEIISQVIKTFLLIILSEIEEKSPFSLNNHTTSSLSVNVIFCSLTLVNLILTFCAVIIGKILSELISMKTRKIVSGSIILAFGMISLYLTYINDYVLISNALGGFIRKRGHKSSNFLQKIPKKTEIHSKYIKRNLN